MKKTVLKTTAIMLAVALCVAFSGCIDEQAVKKLVTGKKQEYNTIQQINIHSDYEEISLSYGYNSLKDDTQKQLYNAIVNVVNAVSDEIKDDLYPMEEIELENICLSEGSIRVTIEAFNCDHPEIFWISNTFGYYADEDVTMVHLYSEFSGTNINAMQTKLNAEVTKFLEEMPTDLSEYEREKYIHDKLLNSCVYDDSADSSDGRATAFTMYGALVENSAVCEGYSKSMQYLLKLVGIETIAINGYSKNELHQWCLVNIDDNWYHLDPTWNDQEDTENQTEGIIYTYFNTTDEFIKTDHDIASEYTTLSEEKLCGTPNKDADLFNMPLPECNSEDASYFTVDGANFTAFDDYDCYTNIVDKLYIAALNKEAGFSIKVSDELDFDSTIDMLFYNPPYEFFDYTADVNNMLDTDYKISDNLAIVTYDNQSVVHVQLKYD